jgi:hypothetical protein
MSYELGDSDHLAIRRSRQIELGAYSSSPRLVIHESFVLSQMFTQLVAESHNVQKNTYACTVKDSLSYIPYPYGIVRLASFLNPLSLELSGQPASQTLSSLSPRSPSRPVPSQPIGQRTLPLPFGRLLVIWALSLRPGRMTSARPGFFLFLFLFEGDDRRIRVGLQNGVRIHFASDRETRKRLSDLVA